MLEDIRSVRLYTFHELFILFNAHFEGEKYEQFVCVCVCVYLLF